MGLRKDLDALLKGICPKVYFQPPPTLVMEYPCILYRRDDAESTFADNVLYRYKKRYMVTVIAKAPDSDIPDQIARLPLSSFNRFYTADELNHDVFSVYF